MRTLLLVRIVEVIVVQLTAHLRRIRELSRSTWISALPLIELRVDVAEDRPVARTEARHQFARGPEVTTVNTRKARETFERDGRLGKIEAEFVEREAARRDKDAAVSQRATPPF